MHVFICYTALCFKGGQKSGFECARTETAVKHTLQKYVTDKLWNEDLGQNVFSVTHVNFKLLRRGHILSGRMLSWGGWECEPATKLEANLLSITPAHKGKVQIIWGGG